MKDPDHYTDFVVDDQKVYIKGKIFDTLGEALKYEVEWRDAPVDLEEFAVFLKTRLDEAHINLKINPKFTNRMLHTMLRESTEWVFNDQ